MQKLVFTNGNGVEVDLTDFTKYGVTEWSGLSNTTLNIQTQKVPFNDGSVFLDALLNDRTISVKIAINDGGNLETRYELKRELIALLNPKLGEGVLTYTNDYLSKQITVIPNQPIFANKNSNGKGTLKADVSFTACNPYWEDTEDSTVYMEKGVIEISNDGDIPVNIKGVFLNEETTNFQLKNITNDQLIRIEESTIGIININTNVGEKEVTKTLYQIGGPDKSENEKLIYVESLGKYFLLKQGDARRSKISWSYDCLNWNDIIFNLQIRDFIYIDTLSLFIAVGVETIGTSTDGVTWTFEERNETFNCIEYSEELGLIIIAGMYNVIWRSTDGVSWIASQAQNIQSPIQYWNVKYIGDLNKFVATGLRGGAVFISSCSEDGITWDYNIGTSSATWNYNIAWDDEYIYTSSMLKSADGVTWEEFVIHGFGSDSVTRIYYIDEKYILLTNEGKLYYNSSMDSLLSDWTQVEITDGTLNDLLVSENLNNYIVIGDGGRVAFGSTLDKWVVPYEGLSTDIIDCIYDEVNKRLVLIAGKNIYSTTNGENFTLIGDGFASNINSICYNSSLGIWVVSASTHIYISNDLENWEMVATTSNSITKIVFVKNLNLYIAQSYQQYIYVSSNARDWEEIELGENRIGDIFYRDKENEVLLIIKSGNTLYTSLDGYTWESNTYSEMDSVFNLGIYSYNMEKFYIISNYIYESQDGVEWTVIYDLSGYDAPLISEIQEKNIFLCVWWGTYSKSLFTSKNLRYFLQNSAINVFAQVYGFIYNPINKKVYAYGENGLFNEVVYSEEENIINMISEQSNMGFQLEKGENILLLSADGNTSGTLTFRNRYIGV